MYTYIDLSVLFIPTKVGEKRYLKGCFLIEQRFPTHERHICYIQRNCATYSGSSVEYGTVKHFALVLLYIREVIIQ